MKCSKCGKLCERDYSLCIKCYLWQKADNQLAKLAPPEIKEKRSQEAKNLLKKKKELAAKKEALLAELAKIKD